MFYKHCYPIQKKRRNITYAFKRKANTTNTGKSVEKFKMALWRVLDLIQVRRFASQVKHPPNNSLKLGKKTELKAERIGAFAAEPLCESPRILRTAAYLS